MNVYEKSFCWQCSSRTATHEFVSENLLGSASISMPFRRSNLLQDQDYHYKASASIVPLAAGYNIILYLRCATGFDWECLASACCDYVMDSRLPGSQVALQWSCRSLKHSSSIPTCFLLLPKNGVCSPPNPLYSQDRHWWERKVGGGLSSRLEY